ncbi:MAG TPA: hypothetical protein VG267_12655 [Terracidiphilus sp.]|nr:hypothetical protein [Terracidiphilus sp.]
MGTIVNGGWKDGCSMIPGRLAKNLVADVETVHTLGKTGWRDGKGNRKGRSEGDGHIVIKNE